MGMPNFKRLAELGQLPEYAKEIESLAEVNEKNKIKKEERIEEVIKEDLSQLGNRELRIKCEELGLDIKGKKSELIEKIEAELIKRSKTQDVVIEKEVDGEFVDDLLK